MGVARHGQPSKRAQGPRRAIATSAVLALAVCLTLLASLPATAAATPRMKLSVERQKHRVMSTLVFAKRPYEVRARLNGERGTRLLEDARLGRHKTTLAARDGVRHGRNRLAVTALFPDGRKVTRRRSFKAPNRRPVADAFATAKTKRGAIALSATRARSGPRVPSGTLRHRWQILNGPQGAEAEILQPRSATPLLATEDPGTYRVRNTVTAGGSPGAADETCAVVAPPFSEAYLETTPGDFYSLNLTAIGPYAGVDLVDPGTSVDLGDPGGDPAVDQQYAIGGDAPSGAPVLALVLDRQTLAIQNVIRSDASADSATAIESAITDATCGTVAPLVAIFATGPLSSEFADLLGEANTQTPLGLDSVAFGQGNGAPGANQDGGDVFVIGVPGATNGSYTQVAPPGEELEFGGQLARDGFHNFAFRPNPATQAASGEPTLPRYGLSEGGLTLVEPGTSYAPEAVGPCNQGGYFLATVPARAGGDLAITDSQTFTTNSTCGEGPIAAAATGHQQLLAALNAIDLAPSADPVLVFLQSYGLPQPALDTSANGMAAVRARAAVAAAVAKIGGTPNSFARLDLAAGEAFGYGYSLVGSNFPAIGDSAIVSDAEVSSLNLGGPQDVLSGQLALDEALRYVPASTQNAPLDASAGALETAGEFAVPSLHVLTRYPLGDENGTPAEWLGALQAIAGEKYLNVPYESGQSPCYRPPGGISDVRSRYCGGNPFGENSGWVDQLNAVSKLPVPAGTDPGLWQAVITQLFAEADLIDLLNGKVDSLKQNFTATTLGDLTNVQNGLGKWESSIQSGMVDGNAGAIGQEIGQDVLYVLALIPGLEFLEVGAIAWGLGDDLSQDKDGSATLKLPLLNVAVSAYADQLSLFYPIGNTALDATGNLIAADYQRLQNEKGVTIPDVEGDDQSTATDVARVSTIRKTLEWVLPSNTTFRRLGATELNPAFGATEGTSVPDYLCLQNDIVEARRFFPYAEAPASTFGYVVSGANTETAGLEANRWTFVLEGEDPDSFTDGGRETSFEQTFIPAPLMDPFFAESMDPTAGLDDLLDSQGRLTPPPLGFDQGQFYARQAARRSGADVVSCAQPEE